jgi:hypothetical protein
MWAFSRPVRGFVRYAAYRCVKDTSGISEVMVELDIGTAKTRQEIQTLKNRRDYFNHGKSIQSVVRL